MRTLATHAARIVIVLLLGGLLGATLVRVAPGYGTDELELDSRLSHASVQALRQSSASHETIAVFYAHYLERLVRGDLGFSKTLQEPVQELLAERFPETLKSVGLGLLLAWSLGLTFAVFSVTSRARPVDLITTLLTGALLCVPAAVLALLFLIARAPARLVIGLILLPKVFGYARNLLKHSASQPHVITAWAKGSGGCRVFAGHILPVAGPQLLALAGVSVSLAFAAAIPVEVVCDLPGIGQLAWKAAMGRDMELLINLTMIVTIITLLANSAADLLNNGVRASAA